MVDEVIEPSDEENEEGRSGRGPRKERVLHTRVSDTLAEDIRRIAEDLRVPASNLVRNVLEEVFDVVETMSDDVGGIFEDLLDEADAARDRISRSHTRARSRRRARRTRESAEDRAAWNAARHEIEEIERGVAPPPLPVEWHVVQGGVSRGPFSRLELERAMRDGRVGRDTLVWCAGMAGWERAGEISALTGLFGPPPVPEADPEEA